MLQCPSGELATRVEKRAAQNGNTYLRYVFSKVKCRKCLLKENCHVGKSTAKVRSYSITQVSQKIRKDWNLKPVKRLRNG